MPGPSSRGRRRLGPRPRIGALVGSATSGLGDVGGAGELVGDVLGVAADEPQQCRAAGALPRLAEDHEPSNSGTPLVVAQLPVGGGDIGIDPGEVGLETGGPHDGVDAGGAAVGERGGGSLGGDEAARKSMPSRAICLRSVPMTRSPRARTRRASAESADFFITPSLSSHQNRSRPANRCGSATGWVPAATMAGRPA